MEVLSDIPLLPRVIVTTVMGYLYVIVLIRLTGKRSVAHMNSFDWVINVAIGALTASAILTPTDTVEAWVAIATVIALQVALTKLVSHSDLAARLLRESPILVVRDGTLLRDVMRGARLGEDEVLAAIRAAGVSHLADVRAVVFETDGRLSVMASRSDARGTPDVLDTIEQPPHCEAAE